MSFLSVETFREDLVNIIEQTITARENVILKSLLQFQDNVLQELLSLKLLLYKHCASSSSSDMDLLNLASFKMKNTALSLLSRDTGIFEDLSKKRENRKSSSNESEDDAKYVDWPISQVFQKDPQKDFERSSSGVKALIHSKMSDDMNSDSCNNSNHTNVLDSIGSNTNEVLSSVADLHEEEEVVGQSNFGRDVQLESFEDANESLLDSTASGKVKISPENIKDYYVQLSDKEAPSEDDMCNINNNQAASSTSHKTRTNTEDLENTETDGYRCGYCDVVFEESEMLEIHLTTHLRKKEKKRCKCLICGTICSSKSTMHKHLRRHNGDKPFQCRVCGRAFNLKYSLKRHLMTHTGEKPFKCSVCNKAFSRKDRRDVHARANHPDIFFASRTYSRSGADTEKNSATQ